MLYALSFLADTTTGNDAEWWKSANFGADCVLLGMAAGFLVLCGLIWLSDRVSHD